MKERKFKSWAGTKQIIVMICMVLILATCLTGLFIARKMEKQRVQTELAKNNERLQESEVPNPVQAVDSVILPEIKEDVTAQDKPMVKTREDLSENNDMDIVEEEITQETVEEKSTEAAAVGGPAVTVKEESPELKFCGSLEWPVEGNVIMNYSMDQSIYFATLDQYKYNPAVIIGANEGANVAAAAACEITEIREDSQTGLTVVMDIGDGYKLTYGQLADLNFEEGAHLEAGDVIGTVAKPTKYYSLEGDNLYFAMTKDNIPQNPVDYLP